MIFYKILSGTSLATILLFASFPASAVEVNQGEAGAQARSAAPRTDLTDSSLKRKSSEDPAATPSTKKPHRDPASDEGLHVASSSLSEDCTPLIPNPFDIQSVLHLISTFLDFGENKKLAGLSRTTTANFKKICLPFFSSPLSSLENSQVRFLSVDCTSKGIICPAPSSNNLLNHEIDKLFNTKSLILNFNKSTSISANFDFGLIRGHNIAHLGIYGFIELIGDNFPGDEVTKSLQTIWFSPGVRDNVQHISNNFLKKARQLQTFNFSFPNIRSLGDDFLRGCTGLRGKHKFFKLDRNGYSIFHIGDNFLRNTGIDSFSLYECPKLQVINSGFFRNCRNLRYLYVDGGNGNPTSVGDDFASHCPNLKKIDLSDDVSRAGRNFASFTQKLGYLSVRGIIIVGDNFLFNTGLKQFNTQRIRYRRENFCGGSTYIEDDTFVTDDDSPSDSDRDDPPSD